MHSSSSKIFCLLGVLASLGLLAGCGGGGGGSKYAPDPISSASSRSSSASSVALSVVGLKPDSAADPALPERSSPDWDKARDASRFLAQATFGATAKDIDFVMKNGKEAWLEQQLSLPMSSQLELYGKRLKDFNFEIFPSVMYGDLNETDEAKAFTFRRVIYQHNIWMDTEIWAKDQLRARVAYALSQILVVSQFGNNEFARDTGFAQYADLLMEGAFGNYGKLLGDVTLNPIMGLYLNTLNNPKANPEKFTHPDENYAREVLQLFSIGLEQLNTNGTLKLDANGKPIPTYDQTTVKEFARIFTGWSYSTYDTFAQGGAFTIYPAPIANVNPLKAFPEYHDSGSKVLLDGQAVPANQTPAADIQSAMNNIMSHPNVGPFISKKLIEYLVTSNPSNEYVGRVASVFNDNGKGVKGDMKAVVKAILLDSEATTPPTGSETYYGKLKDTPLAASAVLRAFKAQGVKLIGQPYGGSAITIGYAAYDTSGGVQEMLHAPSVFNFYSSDYSPPGLIANNHLVAPEFQMFGGMLAVYQTNLMQNLIFNRDITDKNIYTGAAAAEANGYQIWGPSWNPIVKSLLNFDEEIKLANNPKALVDRMNLLLTAGKISDEDIQLIANHISLLTDPLSRVYEAAFLIAISPEFAIQG